MFLLGINVNANVADRGNFEHLPDIISRMVRQESLIDAAEGKCKYHRADHSFRVMKLGLEIFEHQLEIDAPEEVRQESDLFREALKWTAVLHDREMAGFDFDHGFRAAGKVDQIVGIQTSERLRDIIKFLCIYHVPDDSEIENINETQRWILKVFKDADSLDRIRFNNGDKLDERYLRFDFSKTLVSEARSLWERTKQFSDLPGKSFDAVFNNGIE